MTVPRDTVARLQWDPENYERNAEEALQGASTADAVESVSVSYLGRNSPLKLALREVRDRETGMRLDAIREAVEAAVASKLAVVRAEELERKLTEEVVDVTLPAELLGTVRPRLARLTSPVDAGAARRRGHLPRARLRDRRRPRGRDDAVQLRRARLSGLASDGSPRARSTSTTTLMRTERRRRRSTRWRRSGRRSTCSRSAASTAATRSTRRTSRSSTSSRAL